MTTALIIAIVFLATSAAISDLATGRIPNALTYGAAVVGVALSLGGAGSFASSIAGLLLGVLGLFPFFHIGAMGGGDVKLVGAFGALGGVAYMLEVVFYGFLIGSVFAVIRLMRAGRLLATFRGLARAALLFALPGHRGDGWIEPSADRMPMGAALGAAACFAMIDRQYDWVRLMGALEAWTMRGLGA